MDPLRSYFEAANKKHHLLISVSRHLYATGDGRIKHQKKPFEITLKNVDKAPRDLLVHYLLVDSTTGAFYGEVCTTKVPLIDPVAFLRRAWSHRDKRKFHGMPDLLIVPKAVLAV